MYPLSSIQNAWAGLRRLVSGVAVITALASGVAAGQEVGGAAHPGGYVKGKATPAHFERALPQRRLPPSQLPAQVVLDRVEATDQRSTPGVPLQIGFSREVPMLRTTAQTSALLSWMSIPGGQIAAISLTSPGALGLRLGLLVDQLPLTALLRFYAQGSEQVFEVSGQEIRETLARNRAAGDTSDEARTYWSPVIDGQEITMEIDLPAGVSPDTVMFSIPRVSHLLSSPLETSALQKQIGAAGSCNLDSMCYTSTWELESLATAKMTFTEGGSSYLCTGTLISDNDASTDIPYFLTANHCLSTQTVASTLQTYWFYRASSCNSGTLSPSIQTLTSGATLLYASSNTDTSFLRLNSPAPGGTWKSGWSTDLPVLSTSIVGLHNPKGDLQKISFGTITDYASCHDIPSTDSFTCNPASSGSADHIEVVWSQGTIEGGSSGSGLWAVSGSDHYLVGQLHGGSSSCSAPTSPDYYGSFRVAYNAALSQWLGPDQVVNYTLLVTGGGTGQGTVTGSGINCTISAGSTSGTCGANYASGTGVSLTATSIGVSTFTGWAGDCAGFGTALTCSLVTNAANSVTATFNAAISLPTAAVTLNASAFHMGQTITYQATLTPGSTPTQVDIYLGVLLPDEVTFLSLVPSPRGTIVFASPSGPVLVPFASNVTLTQTVVPFPYTFTGGEAVGTYYTYAALVIAGGDPFLPANQLALSIQAFQFTP
jgi:hypothetical protein